MTTIIMGAFLIIIGSMMNSNKKSIPGVLLAVVGIIVAFV